VPQRGMYDGEGSLEVWWALERAVAAHLVTRLGHKPGMIRVKGIRFSGEWSPHIEDMPGHLEDELYLVDDPQIAPEDDPEGDYQGYGGSVHRWIREQSFVFWNGNDWWVNGLTGDVEST
jgi:hypothetical protein